MTTGRYRDWGTALCLVMLLLWGAAPFGFGQNAPVIGSSRNEYTRLEQLIAYYSEHEMPERLITEACRPDALILPGDRDPLDVVLRRTRALLQHLSEMAGGRADLSQEQRLWLAFEVRTARTDVGRTDPRRALFDEAVRLRRRIAFKNPLLDFDSILFLTHHKQGRGEIHMVDQYEGHNARPGGGLFILRDAFTDHPRAVDVLEESRLQNGRLKGRPLENGSFISLELDYDAEVAYFAWTQAKDIPADASWEGQFWTREEALADNKVNYYWSEETCFHVFRVNLDGTGLVQLTDGRWNDFDPCVLPNGRIAFVSERRGGFLRCGARPNPTFTLHSMMPDGRDIIPISAHETHEWHPSVGHDGMLVYSRWDYVDRDSDIAHHPWVCYPDGRDPRSIHGNYPDHRENRPWMELSIRAIPGSHKYVAVSTPHHGENYGSIVMIDPWLADDGAGNQLRRITPEVHFPESELTPGVPGPAHKSGNRRGQVYGQPWPLDEDFYLCVYDPGEKHYQLCLLDTFGNKILLYKDPEVPCLDPIPLKKRERPPVIPSGTTQQILVDGGAGAETEGSAVARVALMDVYQSRRPWPEGTKIGAIRVVQLFPKTTRHASEPMMGVGNQSLGRGVVSTVPVEEDGSAYFEVPVDVPIYFQALDERGQAVQTMRSLTFAHRGELLVCQGCHERRDQAAPVYDRESRRMALQREPTELTRDVDGSWPLTFSRLVQPVLDRNCIDCHSSEKDAPGLSTALVDYGWTEAYRTLGALGWAKHGGNGWLSKNGESYSLPGQVGAKASELLKHIESGHHGLELSQEDLYRITLWLDLNSNFYGVYHNLEQQARGELVMPVLE